MKTTFYVLLVILLLTFVLAPKSKAQYDLPTTVWMTPRGPVYEYDPYHFYRPRQFVPRYVPRIQQPMMATPNTVGGYNFSDGSFSYRHGNMEFFSNGGFTTSWPGGMVDYMPPLNRVAR